IAVITGGSSGIGLATAKRFVEEGAYVFITGRRQAELDKAVAEIGSNVTGVQGDVSNLDDLDRLYKEVETKKGKLDVLFANAGIAEPVPTPGVTPEHYDRTNLGIDFLQGRSVLAARRKVLLKLLIPGELVLLCNVSSKLGQLVTAQAFHCFLDFGKTHDVRLVSQGNLHKHCGSDV